MKVFSLFLLIAGWFLVISAIALLRQGFMQVFALAGFAVELLGLVLLCRAQLEAARTSRNRGPVHGRREYQS